MSTGYASIGRLFVETSAGSVAYVERGHGPVALFLHGVLLNADLWNGVTDSVSQIRRCISPDLLAHGWTVENPDADVSFNGQAEMLLDFIDALGIDQVDLVGNDSGGGIAQIFAARNPERVRSLVLTNCDTHDGWPPEAFRPMVELAAGGGLGDLLHALAHDSEAARDALAVGLESPDNISDELLSSFLLPLIRSDERVKALVNFFRDMNCAQTVEVEPQLRQLHAPALIVWGGSDPFFGLHWARWLCNTLPNVERLVEVPEGKLFLPLDRPEQLAAELMLHWR